MFIWEPQLMKCPDCGAVFYWPCDPDEFYRCGDARVEKLAQELREAHPEVSDFVGDDDRAPLDVDRGGFSHGNSS